ncbi:protease pro-enzyme activation domain-containing protein [Streptomyces indonesiensis]
MPCAPIGTPPSKGHHRLVIPYPNTSRTHPAPLRRRSCLFRAPRHGATHHRPFGSCAPSPCRVPARVRNPGRRRGLLPADRHVSARLYLNSRNPQGLANLLRDISDPRSPHYRHYLTPAAYQRRFSPTASQLVHLNTWLKHSRFTITERTPHYMKITGTARAVQQAFGTSLHRYRTGHGTSDAPSSDLSVPAPLAATVLGVSGLSTPGAARPLSTPTPGLATSRDGATCSGHFGQRPATGFPKAYGKTSTYAPCPYTPTQLRHAYGAGTTHGATGHGSTVAIVDAYGSPDMPADADRYARATDDHAFGPHQYRQHVTPADWHVSDACAAPATGPANRRSTSTSPTALPPRRTSSTSVPTRASTTI